MIREHWGTSTVDAFFATAEARHLIWAKRKQEQEWPWTDDPIFLKYKFTNVFRELDTGTQCLKQMLPTNTQSGWVVIFNVVWYRMLNRASHAIDIGACTDYDDLRVMLMRKKLSGAKIFTGCHMHSGSFNDNLKSIGAVWRERHKLADLCKETNSLEAVFDYLRSTYNHIGKFIGYEIVTDLRHYPSLWRNGAPSDFNTWANVGPGSRRGMERLALTPTLDTMVQLLNMSHGRADQLPTLKPHIIGPESPAFELREIEHWLCEFDKYERARTNQGNPKQVYRPS